MSDKTLTQRFKDKVAIVTGGCDGVGRGCVDILAENGGKVVVFDINDEMGSALGSDGTGEIIYIHCDMTKESEIQKSIEETDKRFGRIDCLVNNVGMHPGPKNIDDLSVQSLRDILEINLISNFAASKYALPHLRKSKGCIVNISSNCASAAFKNSSTYAASKGGVSSLTRALAIDEAKYGVRVNSIAPAPVETRLARAVIPVEEREKLSQCNHMNRFAQTREIGLACLFLAADATFTTGEELMCTGGAEIGYGVKGGSSKFI